MPSKRPAPAKEVSLVVPRTRFAVCQTRYSMVLKDSYLLDKLINTLPSNCAIAKVAHTKGNRYYDIKLLDEEYDQINPQDLTRFLKRSFGYAFFVSPALYDTKTGVVGNPNGHTYVSWTSKPRPAALEGASHETLNFVDDHVFTLNKASSTYYPGYLPWLMMHPYVKSVMPQFVDFEATDHRYHHGKGEPYIGQKD